MDDQQTFNSTNQKQKNLLPLEMQFYFRIFKARDGDE